MSKRLRAIMAAALSAALVASLCLVGCASSDYEPELKSPTVNPPTIGQTGKLRVGVNTAKSPLAGMGNNKIIGIDVDIAAAIADELGLAVEVIDVGADAEKSITEGKVDIVMGLDSSDTSIGLWLSPEYLPTGVAIFAMTDKNANIPTVESAPKITAQTSSKSAWAVTNEFGADSLISANDLTAALNNLKSGSADYLASDAVIGMYAANRQGMDVEIVAVMDTASGYCVGVSQDNTQLQTTISGTLTTLMNNGTIDVIEKKWLGNTLDLTNTPKTAGVKASSDKAENKEEADAESQEEDGASA